MGGGCLVPAPRLGTGGGREARRVGVTVVFLLPEGWRWFGKWGSHVQVPRPMSLYHVPYAGHTSHVPVPCPMSLSHVPCPGPTSLFQAPHPTSGSSSPPMTPSRAPSTTGRGDAGDPSHRVPSRLAALNQSRGLWLWGGAPHTLLLGLLLVPWVLLALRGLRMPWGQRGDTGPPCAQPHGSPAPRIPSPTSPGPHWQQGQRHPQTSPKILPPQNPSWDLALPRAAAGTKTQPAPRLQPPVAPGGN